MLLGKVGVALLLYASIAGVHRQCLRICARTGASRTVFNVLYCIYVCSWGGFLYNHGSPRSGKTLTLASILLIGYLYFYVIRYLINLMGKGGKKPRALVFGGLTDVDRASLQRQMREAHT